MNFYRLMLGQGSSLAADCLEGGYIGVDYGIHQDLTASLHDNWRSFNAEFRPVYLAAHEGKSRIAADLACGMLWTVCKGMQQGDRVLCPDGAGRYRVAEVVGDYWYVPGEPLPHRRAVRWQGQVIERSSMSEMLRNSCGSIGTVCNITQHAAEITRLSNPGARLIVDDDTIDDPYTFAMERHLEDFLVQNWQNTELGRKYDIYRDDNGDLIGRQYMTDTGPVDILAISRDRTELLVVELKKGRASDVVVGQTLRYMGYVAAELADDNQMVRGAIIALDDDIRLQRALRMTPNIGFYRYQIAFRLLPSQ